MQDRFQTISKPSKCTVCLENGVFYLLVLLFDVHKFGTPELAPKKCVGLVVALLGWAFYDFLIKYGAARRAVLGVSINA